MTAHHLMLFLHILAVVVWVGGMAFAYMCLRPAASALPPPLRLGLWVGVLSRFFTLVWIAIALILISGLWMLFSVGVAGAPKAWIWMAASGSVMMLIFVTLWIGPWGRLKAGVAVEDWPAAAIALGAIRQRVGINVILGVITIAIATLGPGWS